MPVYMIDPIYVFNRGSKEEFISVLPGVLGLHGVLQSVDKPA